MFVSTKLGHPMQRESALDFGCGVGRLTRALSRYFNQSYGIDISASMIKKAQELNQSYPNCQFIFNDKADLRFFSDLSLT
jgi:ubiquinone/menaquinone biosynthesis C-methylase UbiE